MVALKEVAKLAKTSPAVVSQVLNNKYPTIRVGQETRKRVLEVIEKLDYRPNQIAKSLRTQKTTSVGVIAHNVYVNYRQIDLLTRKIYEHGYEMLFSMVQWYGKAEDNEIRRLLDRQIDGLLLLSPALDMKRRIVLKEVISSGFPCVSVGYNPILQASIIDWDRKQAYYELTTHLLEQGCKDIVFFAKGESPSINARYEGVVNAIADKKGIKFRWIGKDIDYFEDKSPEALAKLFKSQIQNDWPDAIICQTDIQAAAIYKLAIDEGKRIPEELAITGCSDEEYGKFLPAPLTTIRMPIEELITQALNLLFEKINKVDLAREKIHKLIPAKVVIRESSLFGHNFKEKKIW